MKNTIQAIIHGTTPKYSTKEVAAYITNLSNAMFVLGSATPEVTTYYKALEDKIKLFTMTKRPATSVLPEIIMVDKKLDKIENPNSVITARLKQEIFVNMQNNEQTMIFINKRGYSSYLTCTDCSFIVKCEKCDIPMTYHKKSDLCLCHYCNSVKKHITNCPICGSDKIRESSYRNRKNRI